MVNPRKKWWIFGIVFIALLLIGGWIGSRAYRESRLKDEFSSSHGVLGDCFVFWSEGDTSVLFYWPKAEGPYQTITKGPLWMIVGRFTDGVHSSGLSYRANSDGRDGFDLEEKTTVTFPSGESILLRHSYSSMDPVEKFTAGERSFSPAEGRLFLMDITGTQRNIIQVNADLTAALGSWNGSTSDPRPLFISALAKIRAQHPEVRHFLDQIGGPIAGK